jgi:hypothetical protein
MIQFQRHAYSIVLSYQTESIQDSLLTFEYVLQEEQYAKWMAACRLAAKGRSLADSSYDTEVKSIIAFLQMQHPAPAQAINPSALDITPEDYVSPRFLRKFKGKVYCSCPVISLSSVMCMKHF